MLPGVVETTLPFQDGSCAGKDCRLGNENPSVERLQLMSTGLPHCQRCDIQLRGEHKCRHVTVSAARTSVITVDRCCSVSYFYLKRARRVAIIVFII